MAFYAFVKRWRSYRVKPYHDMIDWYKEFLRQEWYDNLSPEDKEEVNEYRKRRRALTRECFYMMKAIVELSNGSYW